MLRLLKEIGKAIVRQESYKEVAKQSRVIGNDSYEILCKGKSSKTIKGIFVAMHGYSPNITKRGYMLTDFEKMIKEKDLTSLPIIPIVRQNSKELGPRAHFKVTIQIIENHVVVTTEMLITPGKVSIEFFSSHFLVKDLGTGRLYYGGRTSVMKKTSIEQETRDVDKIIKQLTDSQDPLRRNHPAMSEAKDSENTVNEYLIRIRDDSLPGICKEAGCLPSGWNKSWSRLKKEKEKEQFKKFFDNLQQLSINIPFMGALEQMPKYAKFMKDLLAKRRKEETSKITLNERCSAVLLNKIPLKEKDLGSFTIPCVIGKIGINKALADLGASISLMPYSMFDRLGLGELKPTRMCIELANKSTQYPRGIAENVIVKIDKFIVPVDFVVMDIKEDHKIPIILGRPFLVTAHAMIDFFNNKIYFRVGNEKITFDLEKSMKFSTP
ncbi:DNA-directed DNA polymerase [Tanacetum coccineum]